MSYCRINKEDSDVYLYKDIHGVLCCSGTDGPYSGFSTESYIKMYLHLLDLEDEDKKVPQRAYDRLKSESEELRTYVAGINNEVI